MKSTKKLLFCILCAVLLCASCKSEVDDTADTTTSTTSADTTNTSSDTDNTDTTHQHTTPDITESPDQDTSTSGTLCDHYCATAEDVCTGANRLYTDNASCQAACALIDPGIQGQRVGDTIECRIYHLELGRVDPITHCSHAGEGGGGVCVYANEDLCRRYCGAVLENCTEANEIFSTSDECLQSCYMIPSAGTDGDTEGDSVNCRLTHAQNAATQPAASCPLSTVTANPMCTATLCERYCAEAATICVGNNRVYDYDAECLAACDLIPQDGQDGDNAGNTVQCRLYHLSAAQIDPAFHCPHAGSDGGGVCVD